MASGAPISQSTGIQQLLQAEKRAAEESCRSKEKYGSHPIFIISGGNNHMMIYRSRSNIVDQFLSGKCWSGKQKEVSVSHYHQVLR